MRYFVTGACGFIGQRLTQSLVSKGHEVVAFCRDRSKSLVQSNQIQWVQGDVCNAKSLNSMNGSDGVFHLASLARPWARDPHQFAHVNVDGTRNVLEKAVEFAVKKVVFTSTAGTYGPGEFDELLNEESPQSSTAKTEYEKSKQQAEAVAIEYSKNRGLDVCTVNPTRVFGPGLLSDSNAVTKIIKRFHVGGVRFVPGFGEYLGNYVFIDDVVYGHIAVMNVGVSGRNYLLGGENLTLGQLFELIHQQTNKQNLLVPVPLIAIKLLARASKLLANLFAVPPLLTPDYVKKYTSHNAFSCQRAIKEIGYRPTPIAAAIGQTVDWLEDQTKYPSEDQMQVH